MRFKAHLSGAEFSQTQTRVNVICYHRFCSGKYTFSKYTFNMMLLLTQVHFLTVCNAAASISALPHTCCCSVRLEILITAFWPPHINQAPGFLTYEVLSGFPSGLQAPCGIQCCSMATHQPPPPLITPGYRGWIKACTSILVGVPWLVLPSQSCISCSPISPQWDSSMSLSSPIPVWLFSARASHRIHPLEP